MSQHSFVLSRRVRGAPDLAERALLGLPRETYGGLTLISPFERRTIVGPWGTGPPDRHARAELQIDRRRREPVEVELGAWGRDAVELSLRPIARRPERWSGRRQVRFFDAAHESIDLLARTLEQQTPATPARRPVTRTA